jgi:hypothetical protein
MLAATGAILSTSAGRYAAMALIALALYCAGTVRGRLAGESAHEIAVAQGKAATAQADLAINTAAALAAEREAAAIAATEATYADQIKAYAADVAKRPNSACALTGDDVRRLRNIQ